MVINNNIKRIFLSDLHFGYKHFSNIWFKDQIKIFYDDIIPNLKNNSYEYVELYILGDLFDGRQTIDINIGCKIKDLFNDILSQIPNIYIYILAGNHDFYDKNIENCNINIFNLLSLDKISERIIINYNDIFESVTNRYIYMLSWFKSNTKENLIDSLNLIINNTELKKEKYVLCHCTLPGCGDSWIDNEIIEILIKNNINLISGHIHIPLLQPKINCYNLGSCYPLNFLDSNSSRGYYVCETDDLKNDIYFIKNTTSRNFWRFYDKSFLDIDKNILKNDFIELYLSSKFFENVEFVDMIRNICLENSNIIVYNIPDEINITENKSNVKFDMNKYLEEMIPAHLEEKYMKVKKETI